MEFKEGKTYYLYEPRAEKNVCKAHVLHVLPHPENPEERLIVYRWFGRRKRGWWYGVTDIFIQDLYAEYVKKVIQKHN